MGHMDSMAPSNISRAPMVEQYNNGEQSSLIKDPPPQVVITTDAAPEAWGAILQIVKNNRFFHPEKELQKLTLTEIFQSTITEDGRVFCPTNINNSKWSYTDQLGLRERQKLQKQYQVVQQKCNQKMKKQTSKFK
jgi:hypothetical protein